MIRHEKQGKKKIDGGDYVIRVDYNEVKKFLRNNSSLTTIKG